MGGLVARSFIANYGRQFPCVKLFISLATPWGGDSMAEYGVQQSPLVIPSWIDMQPESDFIQSLYRMKMPASIRFYMFCGYRGNRNPFSSNNDGTISLSSILDTRAQSEARMNYVFDEDHTSILLSRDVVAQYNMILDSFDGKQGAPPDRSGGYLTVHVAYRHAFDGTKPKHTLILRPVDKNNSEIVTFLSDADSGKRLGPFPAGVYEASIVTLAAKPEKNEIPVVIERNRTKALDFALTPDGVIRGCVTASLKPEDKSIGMPDYLYRSSDSTIHIESISLKGIGFYRELEPAAEGDIDYEDFLNHNYLIARDDFCVSTCFGFFGLPAGDYTLMINAKGYRPLKKKYSVTPGRLQYFRITELKPD